MCAKKNGRLAFFDTSALIPLLDADDPLHPRLLHYSTNQLSDAAIDTVVLSEYLVGIPGIAAKGNARTALSQQFQIHSFDARAALVCAELFGLLKQHGQVPKKSSRRQLVKVDAMVVASAIVSGADEFLSDDDGFLCYPKWLPNPFCGFRVPTFVQVRALPAVAEQSHLAL